MVHRMAEITDELLAVAEDDFERRHELRTELEALRREARVFYEGKDANRSTATLENELGACRSQLAVLEDQKLNLVSMSGGSGAGGMSATGVELAGMNAAIEQGGGASGIRVRIAEIVEELERRGVSDRTDGRS